MKQWRYKMGLLDQMMDESLDTVEAAAEFVDFPNGEYRLHITKATAKEYPAKEGRAAGVRVSVIYACIATIQLADTTKTPVDEGSLTSESFNLTAQGLPYFKRYLLNLFGETDGISLGESIGALEGLDITAIVKLSNGFTSTSRQAQV